VPVEDEEGEPRLLYSFGNPDDPSFKYFFIDENQNRVFIWFSDESGTSISDLIEFDSLE
jgi:hypothetical protein